MLGRFLTAVLAAVMSLVFAGAASAAPFPDRLDLPDEWQPEGIAAGKGQELFVGSIPTGDIYRFDARTGEGRVVVDAPAGSAAIGLKADNRDRLFVAGGPTGRGFVYDADTGTRLAEFNFAQGRPTFVNDVVLTNKQAFFTDSQRNVLYVVDTRTLSGFRELALPDIPQTAGFNLNGIAASQNGKTLFAVQSSTGTLWRIDPDTGRAQAVDLGGYVLTNGDGLLLEGRRLYVVQNRLNQIAVFRLDGDGRSGRLQEIIRSAEFSVPTTVARLGNRLYAANARFGTPPTPTTDYWVTQVER
jgi:sugar lactone lactonase YvrE